MRGENQLAAAQAAPEPCAAPSIDQSLVLALEYFRAGRCREAEEIYAKVLAGEPDHALSLHHLGLITDQLD
jgi:hypothetical protein